MKINLEEKYENNIVKRFPEKRLKDIHDLSAKEISMWRLVLWLIKDNYPNKIIDTDADSRYLASYMESFFKACKDELFTIEEWIDYLALK